MTVVSERLYELLYWSVLVFTPELLFAIVWAAITKLRYNDILETLPLVSIAYAMVKILMTKSL